MEAYGIRYDPITSSIMYKGKDLKWNKMKVLGEYKTALMPTSLGRVAYVNKKFRNV